MSFPRYPTYKDSGVEWLGQLPEHWTLSRLGFECDTLVPMRDKPADLDGEIPWIRIEDFEGKFISGSRSDQGVSADTVDVMNLKVLPIGTVLCSCSCSMGATAIVARPLVTNQTFIGIVPKGGFSSDYLYFLFQAASEHLNTIGTGAIQAYLSRDDFRRLRIPRPPLAEQVLLTTFLDGETAKIDALMAEQRRLIDLLKEKRQAVISHAVTKGLNPHAPMRPSGIEWLGDVPAHWEVKPVKRLIGKIESGTSVNASDEPAEEGTLGVLKTSCVYTGTFDPTENKTVVAEDVHRVSCPLKAGTLIVSRMNTPELIGAAGLVPSAPGNLYLPDRLWQVSFSSADLAFIHFWTLSNLYRGQVQAACTGSSSSMKNLGQDQFGGFVLAVPPLGEQVAIVAFLDGETAQFSALTAEAQRAIGLLQERRTALISAAVTGKIDVRRLADTEVA